MIFGTDCGATTSYNTQVSITLAGQIFSRHRNPPVLVVRDKRDMELEWISEDRIRIRVPSAATIYTKLDEADGLTLEYE